MTTGKRFRIGAVFPQLDVPANPLAIRDYVQAVEAMGIDHVVIYDHVVGADTTNRPAWNKPYSLTSQFQEPLVLMAYLAGLTTTLEFMTGVLVLPQRQTTLVAKQAACVDIFLEGRLRLAVGTGWNDIEYEALGADFAVRGKMLDEQMDLLRRFWTEESITYRGQFHTVTEAGLCPMPRQRPIPLWVGGYTPPAMRRAATLGDGWLPVLPADKAVSELARFRDMVAAAGRDPGAVGVENMIFAGNTMGGPIKDAGTVAAEVAAWRDAGADGIGIHTMGAGLGGPDGHLAFLRQVLDRV